MNVQYDNMVNSQKKGDSLSNYIDIPVYIYIRRWQKCGLRWKTIALFFHE